MCVMLLSVDFVVTRPEEEKVDAILRTLGMSRKDLKCSICGEDLSDLKHLRAIFPYKSALICCDKFECLSACRDELIAKEPV
ncbi:MAG: hypothetical protein AOA66_0781 [Candidatus Bathyarchaeota archaeon BA2]|nr:MAG: hypothetical protein AOA66_0781 [Candidatus Bathyarchaeota archaeon BA2]